MGITDGHAFTYSDSTHAADSLRYATTTLRASDILKVRNDLLKHDGTKTIEWLKAPSYGDTITPWIHEATKKINQLAGLNPQAIYVDECATIFKEQPAIMPNKTKGYKMKTLKARFAVGDVVEFSSGGTATAGGNFGKVSEIRFKEVTHNKDEKAAKKNKLETVYIIGGYGYNENYVVRKMVEAKK